MGTEIAHSSLIPKIGVPARLELLKSTRAFERLFEGYESLLAVTYVAEARTVLDLFDRRGLGDVELVLGESFTEFRSSLEPAILEGLVTRVESGSLRLHVPKKTIHSKLYILKRRDAVRILHGSRNLYPSGSWDSVAVLDLPSGHPQAEAYLRHYEEHREACTPFLGDLLEQLRKEPERRAELLEAWLQRGSPEAAGELPSRIREATERAILDPTAELLTVELPEAPAAQRELEGFLSELRPTRRGRDLLVRTDEYLRFVERRVRLPIMAVDSRSLEVRLVMNGQTLRRAAPLPAGRAEVDRALDHLERYVGTAADEKPSPWDLQVHSAAMAEAILYCLSSPFFHELMKIRRSKVGLVDRRGPLFLLIYGRSSNGKSTFLQFALKLLAGQPVAPLPGRDFKETTLQRVRTVGTVFPLVFDDVPSVIDRRFEAIIKTYWEKNWEETTPVPTLIFSTNVPTLKDWARTRVKKVAFPVYFHSHPERKEALNRLLQEENPLFQWFSHRYLARLRANPPLSDDDLALSRQVFLELYDYAGRPVPAWFPREPFESMFDIGRLEWHDLLNGVQKASLTRQGTRIRVDFTRDMQPAEVAHYESLLPLDLNKDRRGNTLLVLAPERFDRWLSGTAPTSGRPIPAQAPTQPSWSSRIRRALRRPP